MVLDLALKSPKGEYQTILREAIKKSGKTQSRVANDAGIEPGNLSHILAGRRKPMRSLEKNRALIAACDQPEYIAFDLQFAAEEYYALNNQSRAFRRHMVVTTLVLNSLLNKTIGALESYKMLQDDKQSRGESTKTEAYIPESLTAMRKIIESLRYMWPIEPYEKWDDYPDIKKQILKKLAKLPSSKAVGIIVEKEVDEALEWVYDQGDLDDIVEKNELVRRLASMLGINEEPLKDIIIGVGKLAHL